MIKDYFITQIMGRCDRTCTATQDAIDSLAAEFGRGRAHFLEVLGRLTQAEVHELILIAWARAPLTLATGKSRAEWLDLFD